VVSLLVSHHLTLWLT